MPKFNIQNLREYNQSDYLLRKSHGTDAVVNMAPINSAIRSSSQFSEKGVRKEGLSQKHFAVYTDRDDSQENLMNFLDKVGSIKFSKKGRQEL